MKHECLNKFDETEGRLIKTFGDKRLKLCGKILVFDDFVVAPEFWAMSFVPWDIFMTFRFNKPYLKKSTSEQGRREFTRNITTLLNAFISWKHPDNPAGKSAFKYWRVNETGTSEDEIHNHVLLHMDANLDSSVSHEAYRFLETLLSEKINGLESKDIQIVHDPIPLIAYVCKYEKNRLYKFFDKTKRFRRIICKRFPCDPIDLGNYSPRIEEIAKG